MRLLKRLGVLVSLAAIVAALGVLTAGPVRADTLTVCPGQLINGHNGNIEIEGPFGPPGFNVCAVDGVINGNIKITGGTLLVAGTVNGNIEQEGAQGVGVCGTVNGNIKQEGEGRVVLLSLTSPFGPDCLLFLPPLGSDPLNLGPLVGVVNGNISEDGEAGDTFNEVTLFGVETEVNGNISEKSEGSVLIFCGQVDGNVEEEGDGGVVLLGLPIFSCPPPGSVVDGNVSEKGAGDVLNLGTVTGNIDED